MEPITATALPKVLGSLGKTTFVLCSEKRLEKQADLTKEEVMGCNPNPKRWTGNSLGTRTSTLKRIYFNNKEGDALKICISDELSPKLPLEIKNIAKNILDKISI